MGNIEVDFNENSQKYNKRIRVIKNLENLFGL